MNKVKQAGSMLHGWIVTLLTIIVILLLVIIVWSMWHHKDVKKQLDDDRHKTHQYLEDIKHKL